MSYILDALRKADAQRERDASRGIHAQPGSPGAGDDSSAIKSRAVQWSAVAVAIAVIAGAGWYFTRSNATAPAPAPVTANNLPPATPLRMTPPQAVASAIVPPPPPAQPQANTTVPQTRGMPQTGLVPGISTDEQARQAREAAFSQARNGPPPGVAPQPAPAVAQAPAPAPVATGLPPDAPKITISGGVYSPSPAQRMLIVNGQVFNEGSEVAPGLVVDNIEPRTAILKFRGSRYTVAY
ncbi:MAG TPA: general secretion pathway protein GspB [Ramlibacter sp.]|nr:general secretion pathway protein GspB [Ramlibacter sp.]